MLTKTFRAQNMLMALKNVQAELGPDAMIISMREVPAGSVWAAWRKPGVEVIASRSTNLQEKTLPETDTKISTNKNQEKIVSSNSDELKREIEYLKKIVTGQKIPTNVEVITKEYPTHSSKPSLSLTEPAIQDHKFNFSDFKSLHEYKESKLDLISSKTTHKLVNTETIVVGKNSESLLPPKLLEIKYKLIDQGINIELIDKIINTNLDALSPAALEDYSRLDRFIKRQLNVCLPPSRKSLALVPSRIMILTGPSGSGKTSCCAKLASFYMITMGKKVVWIEADTVKTSAIAEARTYTETLGIPLFLAYTPQELTELVNSQKDADLILIDTASCNPRNESSVVEFGSFLSSIPSGCTYLVVSATTKEQDLIQVEKTYRQFGLKGIILTKTDETGSFGASFNFIHQSKLPLFFITSGIQIFGNLKQGNPEQLVNAVLAGEFPRE